MRRAAFLLGRLPYFLFLICILTPVATLAYALAAVCRTAASNWKAGWTEHD